MSGLASYRSLSVLLPAFFALLSPLACHTRSLPDLRFCKTDGDCLPESSCTQGLCTLVQEKEAREIASETVEALKETEELLKEAEVLFEPLREDTERRPEAESPPDDLDKEGPFESLLADASPDFPARNQGRESGVLPDRVNEPPTPEPPQRSDSRIDPADGGEALSPPDKSAAPEDVGRDHKAADLAIGGEKPTIEFPPPPDFDERDGSLPVCLEGEIRPCYPPNLSGCKIEKRVCFGACAFGRQTCLGGQWTICQGAITPVFASEAECDGVDRNCNGIIDDQGRCNN